MYELRDANPVPEIPKPKKIMVGGVELGTVEPSIDRDSLRWHAVIHLTDATVGINAGLAQGHGYTPDAAIVDAIVSARIGRDRFASALAAVERGLDLASKTNEQLAGRRSAR
jgi:hypothetical protein